MKLTKWYPAHIKPAHIGIYNTRYSKEDDKGFFNVWDGSCWLSTTSSPIEPFFHDASSVQDIEWRGLAEKP